MKCRIIAMNKLLISVEDEAFHSKKDSPAMPKNLLLYLYLNFASNCFSSSLSILLWIFSTSFSFRVRSLFL